MMTSRKQHSIIQVALIPGGAVLPPLEKQPAVKITIDKARHTLYVERLVLLGSMTEHVVRHVMM